MATLRKVISGGQTGVDRAALAAARAAGLAIGGWCPPGRASEAGPIPLDLPLTETPAERSTDAPDVPRSLRTEWNVRDADATLVLSPAVGAPGFPGSPGSPGSPTTDADDPGTTWAVRCAERYGRPLLVVSPERAVRVVHRAGDRPLARRARDRHPERGRPERDHLPGDRRARLGAALRGVQGRCAA